MNFRKSRARSRRNSVNIVAGSEKWRHPGRHISRREADCIDEDTDEEEMRPKDITNWEEEFFGPKRISDSKSDQDMEVKLTKKQTIILSTLLPDEILLMEKFGSAESKRFVGVLLMADVSGYTSLSERYNNTGKGGTYRLTVTLNTYLGSLIEIIYSHGGDVLKFAGDAFLALWKTDKRSFLCHTIHSVIECALTIQHSYGTYETDVKVNLNVKLAISAGNLIFAPIGTGIDMNYVIFGLPVLEAKEAESHCSSGEVKLTGTAWGHCYSRNYDHYIHDNGLVTIKSILYDPRNKDVMKPFHGLSLVRKSLKPFSAIENLPDYYWDTPQNLSVVDVLKRNEALSLRPSILRAEEKNIGSDIRKFMIRPVLTQIDAHQPLEYLTEMRQVSVVFLTLKPRECPFLQLITIVNNSYQIICDIVYKSMGCVNKIILFDKDVMILVIFGLRGFKHESEAQAALKCGYSIRKSVSALDGVMEVSVGVTTGQVYCGVVGHPLRREFTVIGATVNLAARLMCNYRNKITCDETTFVKSKMSSNGFTIQPKTELKGICHPGKIFEYTEEIRVKELFNIPMIPHILDRADEMEYFEDWLNDSHHSYRDFDALLVVGESRIGKTRFLEWMARYARNNMYRVCYISLTSIHSATPFLALSQIVNQILGLKEPLNGFEKEEKIVQMLQIYDEDLCYLNNIVKVRFAYQEGMHSLDEHRRKEKAILMFQKLVAAITETHVIFLDDLQNLDPSSWEFISLMFDTQKVFIVFTVTRGKFSSVHSWLYSVFINSNVRKIVLGPLVTSWIAPLACQILDVDAVPNDLCNALKAKCKGMPGLVESFIVHLFSSGALELKKINDSELEDWKTEDLQFPDPKLLHPQALDAQNQENLDQLIQEEYKGEITICMVTQKEELKTNINVQNVDALVMIQIDSLTPYQQLLLKIASVVGNVISRDLLENIMYENDTVTTAKAIKRLFAMRLLSCANVKYRRSRKSLVFGSKASITPLSCECLFEFNPDDHENLPKYAFCKIMQFKNHSVRKTCYELLPLNQKKEFHTRIVSYLESFQPKCPQCGGSMMVVESFINLTDQLDTTSRVASLDLSFQSQHSNNDESSSSAETILNSQEITQKSSIPGGFSVSDGIRMVKSESFKTSIKSSSVTSLQTSVKSEVAERNYNQSSILAHKTQSSPQRRSTKRVTMQGPIYDRLLMNTESISLVDEIKESIFDKIRQVTEADKPSDWEALGAYDSEDSRTEAKGAHNAYFSVKIESGASQTNFSKCTCGELKIIIYEQLIFHAKQAELKLKSILFLITYSHLSILSNNNEDALPKLNEAEKLCLEKKPLNNISAFDIRRYLGKIYTLRAVANLMARNYNVAKIDLDRAFKIYHINVRKVSEFFKIRTLVKTMARRKYRVHEAILASDSVLCLNVGTMLYSAIGDETTARIFALRAIESIQKVECEIVDMFDAFSNMIQLELDRGAIDITVDLERVACNVLRQLSRPIKVEELCSLGKLFVSTFRSRIARAELPAAIRSGFRSIVISRFLQADTISLDIIPNLFYVLLARRRIAEAIDLLQEALRLGEKRPGLDCEIWYYALCIDLILDAGFQLEAPSDISRFAEYAISKDSNGQGQRRLITSLWTYWLRADVERRAKRFESEALNWLAQEDDDGTLTTLISAMRLAEGMLESLARKVDDLRKVVDLMELRSLADRELSRLEKDARECRTIYPRWLLLRANSYHLSGRQAHANLGFAQALDEARKCHNRLEEATVQAALLNSPVWFQSARAGFFMRWQEGAVKALDSWQTLLYKCTTTR